MRMANRRDSTHATIVAELRRAGFSVRDTSRVGDDFPDILVGRFGEEDKFEIKGPDGDLTEGQIKFAHEWQGRKPIVARTSDEIIAHFNQLLQSEG